ncbi:Oidioi.mRNA.OKI2018_I69.PAR.g11898.t1.cds [Oikopleura dioica]|uniref:Oidioi.mRNA.OKI2018_I69.PAR.g11898.t1.cds n=1 Tax=Oikopleura dioica TaxID=34765 RepID=A0ABN7S3G8_OIKDI|nr:Oidioi.mRNA.OKI2018_I69.PAR.g11898.t1.cds [Oikopleura dioica]
MSAILKALGPIFNIFILLVFFIVVFAIVGVEFYAGGYHSHCVSAEGEIYGENQLCVGNVNTTNGVSWSARAPYTCPPEFSCEIDETGPFDGIINFDDVLFGMLTVFQILTMESWTAILYLSNDGTTNGNALNSIIFVLMVVIGALFMLNLVIGVLSGEFSKERERVEKRNAYLAMREDKDVNSAMNGYLRWIQEGEAIMKAEEEAEVLQTRLSLRARRRATALPAGFGIPGEEEEEEAEEEVLDEIDDEEPEESWGSKIQRGVEAFRAQIRALVRTQFWFWLILSLVLINTLLRCSIHYNMPTWYDNLLSKLEITFLVFFTVELLLKWFGLGSEQYQTHICVMIVY